MTAAEDPEARVPADRTSSPRHAGRQGIAVLLASLALTGGPSQAEPERAAEVTEQAPADTVAVPEPMRVAMLLAKAAGGGVGFVGATLSLDDSATAAEVAIIQPVGVEKMKTGEILMLAQDNCTVPDTCLMARRIVEKRGADVATKHYGRPPAGAPKEVEASLLGRVAYVVNLDTGRIRDLRHDDAKEISLHEALRREARRWHYVGNTVRPRLLLRI